MEKKMDKLIKNQHIFIKASDRYTKLFTNIDEMIFCVKLNYGRKQKKSLKREKKVEKKIKDVLKK